MRKFRCYSCGHKWFFSHEQNGHGIQHVCPKCGSDRIQFSLTDMIRELQASVVTTNPALLCVPTGFETGYTYQKWMTD